MSRYLASAAMLTLLAIVACSPRGPEETPASSEAASEAMASSLPPADYTSLANVMTCDWPVKKTDTAESLLATYKSYAHVGDTYDENGPEKAVIIYGNDPRRRVVVLFHDDAMTEVKEVRISDDSQWSGPKGLHVGST
ncbi:MAG TPA: hypothetical protein VLZ84_02185, partial [Asticcacaulis sp.]|nr:hypothetical protein [Asticcacaulis sp.]